MSKLIFIKRKLHFYLDESKYNLGRRKENTLILIAKRCPRWLKYWVFIDCVIQATSGKYEDTVLPEITAFEVLERISKL